MYSVFYNFKDKKKKHFNYIYKHDNTMFKNIPFRNVKQKRNELCSCGSNKKYKKCCIVKKESNYVDDIFNNIC